MDPKSLPVYQQREKILEALANNQVIVVESPTGSGKTTQLPVILNEAGYTKQGIVGVTQPRRIAAISVSEFIAKQLEVPMPGLIGYKMRFEDKTDRSTRIKIMTDGILLQEMKLDPLLSKYSIIMVDEAHERSLNIDFILGLLKRVLESRPEFKVIVSSATINAEVFSAYFGDCPIVKIDTQVYPVTVIWEPPILEANPDSLLEKIAEIVGRIVSDKRKGDILIFLPGEKLIKDCMELLSSGQDSPKLFLMPLYARLGKDEQARVFEEAPPEMTKVVIATNIAEASVTINGITSVIDSGLAKLNFYNSKTFTSSLVQVPISRASANQRKGRAGRTAPGFCYRLYNRADFENRSLFTMEEIYRTDLSEVLLRMAELGIKEFERFDFISKPPRAGILGAMEILKLLDALEADRSLSRVGVLMCAFPLLPRLSRMIVEAMLRYPNVIEEVIIAAAFLSTQSPYVLPPGEELEARKAHHSFRDPSGDFVSYLMIYKAFLSAKSKAKFCELSYLDERSMMEIVRIKEQIELIVHELGFTLANGGAVGAAGATENYLCAVSRGLIQFICAKESQGLFRTIMGEKVQIHPGSVMFRENPEFLVAGEIVKTTRMYAMSVSPLQKRMLSKISPFAAEVLLKSVPRPDSAGIVQKADKAGAIQKSQKQTERDFTNRIKLGGEVFEIITQKKRKKVVLEWERFKKARENFGEESSIRHKGMLGVITIGHKRILDGEKLDTILKIAHWLDPENDIKREWPKKRQFNVNDDLKGLIAVLDNALRASYWKPKQAELGFISLFTDSAGSYWFRVSRGLHTAINETLASLEALVDDISDIASPAEKEAVGALYRRLSEFFSL